MTATIEGKELLVRIPLQEPKPSKTGKSFTIATTSGNVLTTAQYQGKPIKIGLNAFVPR